MQWLKLFLLFSLQATASTDVHFRTPVKFYAGATTVKVQFKKDFIEYDVPMWIKPDQAVSALDPELMKELGYVDPGFVFDQVKISGQNIEKKRFQSLKTEWAYVPDFAKSCCFGVIGRDILKEFEIRIDPTSPPHMTWTRVVFNPEAQKTSAQFLSRLPQLFSLTGQVTRPYTLGIQEQKLVFEGKPRQLKPKLFTFAFVPPDRNIRVGLIHEKYKAVAAKAGLKAGLLITELNHEPVSGLDRWQIEQYLRGEMNPRLELQLAGKKSVVYHFKAEVQTK